MMIDELLSAALVGTRSAPARLPELPGEIVETLSAASSSEPEIQLLDAIAAVTLYSRSGAKSRDSITGPTLCLPDKQPECTPRAGDLLGQLLDSGPRELLAEWLELAQAARQRPPHRLLPQLLEAGAARRDLGHTMAAVIDERGRWLMQFNPRWQFAAPSTDGSADAWNVGNRKQRAEMLQSVRLSDPAQARELVAATWTDDAADERTEWLGHLLVGLTAADEPFLESCLDDRSSKVREAAADLLARLPQSKFVGRMIERITPLISFTPATTGSLIKLKRGISASLDAKLPEMFDKTMLRDGMTEKPSESLGPRQWWLLQMLSSVPLAHWTGSFAAPAASIVEAAPAEFAAVFSRGWLRSFSRQPEPEWIVPLLGNSAAEVRLEPSALAAIPAEMRAHVLSLLAEKASQKHVQLPDLIAAWRPLAEDVSHAMLAGYDVPMLLGVGAAFHLHPRTLAKFEMQFADLPENPYHRRKADEALSVMALRRELQREFSK